LVAVETYSVFFVRIAADDIGELLEHARVLVGDLDDDEDFDAYAWRRILSALEGHSKKRILVKMAKADIAYLLENVLSMIECFEFDPDFSTARWKRYAAALRSPVVKTCGVNTPEASAHPVSVDTEILSVLRQRIDDWDRG